MLYDFDELLVAADLEGDVADEQLIGEDADRPDVDLLVVLLALEDLGRDVEGCAAESTAELSADLVDGPAEVAELDGALSEATGT